MGRNYWMVVESLEKFETTRDMGFKLHGMKSRYRRRAQRMQPDDRILFYVSSIKKWTATATVTSQFFEDHSRIWSEPNGREDYIYRVKLAPSLVLEERDYIDALILAPRLDYVKRWPPEDWPLAFSDSLHLLPQKDFRLIEDEMKRNVSKRNPRRGTTRMDRQEDITRTNDVNGDDFVPDLDVPELPDETLPEAEEANSVNDSNYRWYEEPPDDQP